MVAEKNINFASQRVIYSRQQRWVNYRIKKAYAREPQPVSGHTIKETQKKLFTQTLFLIAGIPTLPGILMEA